MSTDPKTPWRALVVIMAVVILWLILGYSCGWDLQ